MHSRMKLLTCGEFVHFLHAVDNELKPSADFCLVATSHPGKSDTRTIAENKEIENRSKRNLLDHIYTITSTNVATGGGGQAGQLAPQPPKGDPLRSMQIR